MRQVGTVKFYNGDKGYGFIAPDDGGKDVFVHVTALEQSGIGNLSEGSPALVRDRTRQARQRPQGRSTCNRRAERNPTVVLSVAHEPRTVDNWAWLRLSHARAALSSGNVRLDSIGVFRNLQGRRWTCSMPCAQQWPS